MESKKKNKVIKIISKILNVDTNLIDESSNMDDFSKWDSLAHLQIMTEVEKQFQKKISTSKMDDLGSVKKILEFLES